jgi:hypothetical protein
MAVSYLSKIYESNPYVLPVDLGLLAKVNNYKQSLFYQNASALKQEYSALKNSDILNPEQKAVLDEKYNNLSNSVNSWGGVDYSDMGIVNQMEGMAASIYSDPTVLSGIASTKKVRALMSNYEKMKTDPKLMKYYNPGNEQWDMQSVNEYISGGKDATYTGNTAPSIYKGNPYTRLTETIKKLKPNIETHFDASGNPYYIQKNTNTVLDPTRVLSEMEGQIDADIMNQIKIDAWYNMRGVDNTKLEEIYTNQHNSKIAAYADLLTKNNRKLELATTNDEKTQIQADNAKINNLIAEQNSTYNLNNFRKKLNTKEGNIDAKAGIYLNKLFDDGIKANSYQQVQNSLQVNIAEIQKDKRELALMQMQNARDIAMMRASAQGNKKIKNTNGAFLTDNATTLLELQPNTQELKELQDTETVTINKIALDNKQKNNEISLLLNDFLIRNAASKDDENRTDYLGLGNEDKFKKRLGEIAKLDGQEGLSLNDVKVFINNTSLSPTDKEKQFFQKTISVFDGAAKGDYTSLKNTNFSKSDFKATYEQYADKLDKLAANTAILTETRNKAFENFTASKNLSAAESQLVTEFIQNPKKYIEVKKSNSYSPRFGMSTSTYIQFNGNKQMEAAIKKAGIGYGAKGGNIFVDDSFNKSLYNNQNEILKDSSFRQNYYSVSLPYEEINKYSSEVKSLVSSKLPNDVDVDSAKILQLTQAPTTSKEYNADTPWYVTVQYKTPGGGFKKSDIYITNAQASSAFGVSTNTRQDLETTLLYKKELTPRFTTNDTWGDKGIFKYQVIRPGGKNGQIEVWVTGDNNEQPIKIKKWAYNGNMQPFSNGTQALEIMKNVIESAHTRFPDRTALLQAFKDLESQ